MPTTVPHAELGSAAPGWNYARDNGDGTTTLYYGVELPPPMPGPSAAEIAAAEAALVKDAADAQAARQYAKLRALSQMTPAQVQVWVAANVTNLAQAQDAITTLAIAVSLLARRL